MNVKEAAALLLWRTEQVKDAIKEGVELPKSRKRITLAATGDPSAYDIDDESLDEFLSAFEGEQPGRWPPVQVRRDLLVEAGHKCAICRESAPLHFHHMLEFAKLGHHDARHMLVVCGTCHDKIHRGDIDYHAQVEYKKKLQADASAIPPAEQTSLHSLGTSESVRCSVRIPHAADIDTYYKGDREAGYERELERSTVVAIWGRPGIGKTWVAARLAARWNKGDLPASLGLENWREALWCECRPGASFASLISGIARCVSDQGIQLLAAQIANRDANRIPMSIAVDQLVELLNQYQFLLCLDDFHYASEDEEIRRFLERLETTKTLNRTTKVLLVGEFQRAIPGIGGHELPEMTGQNIQSLLLSFRELDKEWLDEKIASDFANRLTELFGANLMLMDMTTFDWLKNNTTRKEAEDYIKSLTRSKIATIIWDRDKSQRHLLTILCTLSGKEDLATISRVAKGYAEGMAQLEVSRALEMLVEAGLVVQDTVWYMLPTDVRTVCEERLAQEHVDMTDLHRCAARIYHDRNEWLQAVNHHLEAEQYAKAIFLLTRYMNQITRAGEGASAWRYVMSIQRADDEEKLDTADSLRLYVLIGDYRAWMGQLGPAQYAVEIGLKKLDQYRLSHGDRSAYKVEEARLKARLGTILAASDETLKQAVGLLEESHRLLEELVWGKDGPGYTQSASVLLMALFNLGQARRRYAGTLSGKQRSGVFQGAISALETCVYGSEMLEGVDDAFRRSAWALVALGQAYDDRNAPGDREQAIENIENGLMRFRRLDDQWGIGYAKRALGTTLLRLGEYEEAFEYHSQGLEVARLACDTRAIILGSAVLAELSIVLHRWTDVDAYLEAAEETLKSAPIGYLAQFVSLVRRWATGVRSLRTGHLAEGESILHEVLHTCHTVPYGDEIPLVEETLRGFDCLVPSLQNDD